MATKTPVSNPNAADYSSVYNAGLKISGVNELFLLAGRTAHRAGFEVVHPDDPIAQTQYIFNDIDELIRANGYTRADIIRHETTFTKAVTEEAFQEIVKLLAEFFADCPVKPVAGTLRIVDSLSRPGLTVEYEFWLAR